MSSKRSDLFKDSNSMKSREIYGQWIRFFFKKKSLDSDFCLKLYLKIYFNKKLCTLLSLSYVFSINVHIYSRIVH